MRERCDCGGEYIYSKEDKRPTGYKSFTRNVNAEYHSGLYLRCELCEQHPPQSETVVRKITIQDEDKIFTKSDFAKKIGSSPQGVDSMIRNGRLKIVNFAGKEFVYYD